MVKGVGSGTSTEQAKVKKKHFFWDWMAVGVFKNKITTGWIFFFIFQGERLKNAPWYTLIVDESTDISVQKYSPVY